MKKRSKNNLLENHTQWKNDNIKHPKVLMKLLKRDGRIINKCEVCNKEIEGRKRQIHHKDKNRRNNKTNNLMVLCIPCHMREDGYGFYVDYAKEHNISVQGAWARFNRYKSIKKRLIYTKEYRLKNIDKLKEKDKAYYIKNREKRKKCALEWYYKNKKAKEELK